MDDLELFKMDDLGFLEVIHPQKAQKDEDLFIPSSVVSRIWEELHSLREDVVLLRQEVTELKSKMSIQKLTITPTKVITTEKVLSKRTREEALACMDDMLDKLSELKRMTKEKINK